MNTILRALRLGAFAAITPLLEKNLIKTLAVNVPVMFSMSRLIVLAFAVGMLRQIWRAGITGWPDATLAVAIVLALPLLGALERATPVQVLDLAKTALGRFGVGDARRMASIYGQEASKHDDHKSGS